MEKAKIDIDEIAKLMEENEIGDLEGLRKIIKDYDSLCEEYLREFGLKSDLQCKRMPSLFRQETLDGKVTYHHTGRVLCYDEEDEKRIPFHCGLGSSLIDKMFPITMPYYPTTEKYVVMFRYRKPAWIKTPEGEKVDL